MLTSAFLLAISLVIIALMLNNIIYYNNIAYIGYMDQWSYDDVSIKNMIVEESINAYKATAGDANAYNQHMQGFVSSMNDVLMPKGYYVTLTTQQVHPWPVSSGTYPATDMQLNISTRDSSKTYSISTTYTRQLPQPATPTPTPVPSPQNVVVKMSSNKTEMFLTETDTALITVDVTDQASGMPRANVLVDLHSNLGEYQDAGGNTIYRVQTDQYGKAKAYFYTLSLGTHILNASVGPNPSLAAGNLSNDVAIVCKNVVMPGVCDHDFMIDIPSLDYDADPKPNKQDYLTVTVPIHLPATPGSYEYVDFKATITSGNHVNLADVSITDISDKKLKGSTQETKKVSLKFNRIDKNAPYSATVTVSVTVTCDIDHRVLTETKTYVISGHPPVAT